MPNVLSPRDLVYRPDNMDETVLSLLQSVGIGACMHVCVWYNRHCGG